MVSTVRYPSFKSLGLRSTSTFMKMIGAALFIGAWTVRQLVREGVEVIGVDAGDDDHRVRELNMAAASASSKGPVWPL